MEGGMPPSGMPDVPVQVPIDNPNADTEWNDILRKHGIIPEKPKDPEPLIQEALMEAQQRAYQNRLEDKDLDELAALEDDEDEAFLESYRQKRMAEINALAKASKFGSVYPLQKVDFTREVTEASNSAYVFVLLASSTDSHVESRVLSEIWPQLAQKYGDVKFCSIRADMCIEGYPERNCPTVLIYRDGDIRRQIVTLRELQGVRTRLENLESVLVEVGAVKEGDPRVRRRYEDEDEGQDVRRQLNGSSRRKDHDDNDDDDWD
ncbi:Proteolipid protein 2 [Neophaeococcomyces mojaviensis]|uniref:Proteolipid protein 2 n=1 Tax=Neophaeococcomyces mojaviensis TaxID=3383035 RepID=A0ACC3A9X1_9EURO|nr:Proteolipid protein 2 [Knufia sp. JES_112]